MNRRAWGLKWKKTLYCRGGAGYIDRGRRIYILERILAEFLQNIYFACASAHARERVSARIYGWGPGARLRAPGGVQWQSPGGGPGGGAPEALGF